MTIHSALRSYQAVTASSLTGREAESVCFRLLIDELEKADSSADPAVRAEVLAKHQRLWSMIMKANSMDDGQVQEVDRELFARMAGQAQDYGIRAILDTSLSLAPLIGIAENVLAGLEAV